MSLMMRSAMVAPTRPVVRARQTPRSIRIRALSTPTPVTGVAGAITEAEEICASGKAKVNGRAHLLHMQ